MQPEGVCSHDPDDILQRFLGGDPHAHADVVGWIRSVIFCRYLRLAGAADDIIQETLFHVLRAVGEPGFKIKKDFRAFVRHVAMARCIEVLRRQRTVSKYISDDDEFDPETVPSDHREPSQEVVRQQALLILRSAIARLSFACQEIFRLRLWDGYTFDQIAVKLERTSGGMKARFFVCKDSLRAELNHSLGRHDLSPDDLLDSFD